MKNRKIHYIIELILMLICLGIGMFEDAFILAAFVVATFYNLLYIVVFRNFTGETLKEGIANIILIWAIGLTVLIVGYLIFIFIFGHTAYGLFASEGTTYYGVDAWKNSWGAIIFTPVALINIGYVVLYLIIKNASQKRMQHKK